MDTSQEQIDPYAAVLHPAAGNDDQEALNLDDPSEEEDDNSFIASTFMMMMRLMLYLTEHSVIPIPLGMMMTLSLQMLD